MCKSPLESPLTICSLSYHFLPCPPLCHFTTRAFHSHTQPCIHGRHNGVSDAPFLRYFYGHTTQKIEDFGIYTGYLSFAATTKVWQKQERHGGQSRRPWQPHISSQEVELWGECGQLVFSHSFILWSIPPMAFPILILLLTPQSSVDTPSQTSSEVRFHGTVNPSQSTNKINLQVFRVSSL